MLFFVFKSFDALFENEGYFRDPCVPTLTEVLIIDMEMRNNIKIVAGGAYSVANIQLRSNSNAKRSKK